MLDKPTSNLDRGSHLKHEKTLDAAKTIITKSLPSIAEALGIKIQDLESC